MSYLFRIVQSLVGIYILPVPNTRVRVWDICPTCSEYSSPWLGFISYLFRILESLVGSISYLFRILESLVGLYVQPVPNTQVPGWNLYPTCSEYSSPWLGSINWVLAYLVNILSRVTCPHSSTSTSRFTSFL